MPWLDDLTAFARGVVSGFVGEYSSPSAYAPSAHASPGATFQSVIRALASHFGAEVHWDEDGDAAAALIVIVQGDHRLLCISLHDGVLHLSAPSRINFPSGCLPRDLAAFLARRNKELDFADWDAMDRNGKAYFTLKAHGRVDRINLDIIKVGLRKMLVEALTLDTFLRKEGYAG